MVTIREVAKTAGVSVGTVSNVLNNVSTVSEENRRKVMDAVKITNYRLNNAARTLKTRISKSVGFIIPDITNPFYPELARGAEDTARNNDYSIFICNQDRNIHKERAYIKLLLEKNVDGIVLIKPYISIEEMYELQQKCSLVAVDMGNDVIPWCSQINIDDYHGAYDALQYVYGLGHRKIAFISGVFECKGSSQRELAYINFFKENGLELHEAYVKRGSYDWHSGYKCMSELLRLSEPPTAILAANDLMGHGALKAARDHNFSVPEQISVLGVDDIDMSSLSYPTLTTVSRPKYAMGVKSMEMMLECINQDHNSRGDKPTVTLETKLIVRDSTGKYTGK